MINRIKMWWFKIWCLHEWQEDLAWAKEQLQKVIELRYKDVLEAKGEK